MHFHLPKPLHGWRQFAGEVGIIVIGVLIALGAEQGVETLHWQKQAEEARAALRAEVGDDNLPQAYARLAIAPCIDAKLKQLQAAFGGHVDRRAFLALAKSYRPPQRTWDDQAWNAVIATGVLSHGGSREVIQWSLPYRLIVLLGPRNTAEIDDKVSLNSISGDPGQLSPTERDRVTVALERLRRDEQSMFDDSRVLIEAAREAGVVMSDQQKRQALSELRGDWGNCVAVPNVAPVDVQSQSEKQFDR